MTTRDEQIAVRDRLQALTDAGGGRLTPQAVLDDARDPQSPLHSHFEWDDEKAAQQRRLDQARTLIRSVEVVIRNETTVVRAPYYVRDPSASGDEQGYVTTRSLRSEADMAREALVQEFARAEHVMRRAKNLAKALGMEEDVGRLMDGMTEMRRKVEERGRNEVDAS